MRKFAMMSSVAILAAIVASPAGALSLNLGSGLGGLINLGDSSAGSANNTTVNVDTGNLLGSGGGGTGGNGNRGLLNLFGDGDGTVADVNLGAGSNDAKAKVTIGGSNDDLLIDLFGPGVTDSGSTTASVGLGLGGLGLGGIGTDGLLDDLFGPGAGGGGAGGSGGAGGTGGGATGSGNSGVLVANIDAGADSSACFMPDARQISTLLNRHNYASSVSSWGGVSNIEVIEIGLCKDAQLRVAQIAQGSSNYMALQSFINSQSAVRAGLRQTGHSADDVVAVDRNGNKLIVYVI